MKSMINNYFDDVVHELGTRQDYFPGTGGNISLKIDNESMFIKASGKRILHMKNSDGIVGLYYAYIRDYFHKTLVHDKGEEESLLVVKEAVHKNALGRPSIETGFHTLLSQATIHSHSVYVNMLTCSSSFEALVDTIFLGSSISYLSISYAKPGYYLTHLFLEKVRKLSSRPRVVFMKNHGIVVTAPTMDEAIKLHEEVNTMVMHYFGFSKYDYPVSSLHTINEHRHRSTSKLLTDFAKESVEVFETINNYILFPDLTVFCEEIIVSDDMSNTSKIVIQKSTGEIFYNTSQEEALCIEENLIAFAFLMKNIREHHLKPVYISEEDAVSIRNMEQEKYRKSLFELL